MKANLKKFLCGILSFLMLLGLCACNSNANNDNSDTTIGSYDGELPEAIYGTWYPHPEVSDAVIEINSDGTCTIDGGTGSWELNKVDKESVVLVVNGLNYLTFSQLTSPFPLLTTGNVGMAVKNIEVWNYITQWYNEETGNSFILDLEELAQVNCTFAFDNGSMTIQVLDGDAITHTVELNPYQATVTDAEGNSTVYFPIDGGSSGGDPSDPETLYTQAMENLQRVLATGNTTVYVDSTGEHRISDSAALEKLYNVFVSLQNHMDVSQQLNCIRKLDNVLLSQDRIVDGVTSPVMDYEYNSFGTRSAWWDVEEAISSGTQIYSYYDESGNIYAIEVWGLVKGEPVYGADGKLTSLIVTATTDGEQFTATVPVTCDAKGNVTRIEIPFYADYVDGINHNMSQVYEFLYDKNGRLIQYSETRHGLYENTSFYEEYSFNHKTITECYYDSNGKLTDTLMHQISIGQEGLPYWYYEPAQYRYNADGLLSTRIVSVGHIQSSDLSREEQEALNSLQYSLFCSQSFLDSIQNQLVNELGNALTDVNEIAQFEYTYGSIYIYQTAE